MSGKGRRGDLLLTGTNIKSTIRREEGPLSTIPPLPFPPGSITEKRNATDRRKERIELPGENRRRPSFGSEDEKARSLTFVPSIDRRLHSRRLPKRRGETRILSFPRRDIHVFPDRLSERRRGGPTFLISGSEVPSPFHIQPFLNMPHIAAPPPLPFPRCICINMNISQGREAVGGGLCSSRPHIPRYEGKSSAQKNGKSMNPRILLLRFFLCGRISHVFP